MASPLSFNEDAENYDEVRPGYPEQLFDDVAALSGIPSGGRILEVGCGSGQATEPLARRGYRMLCLDPGENLLAIARRRLSGHPGVEFLRSTLEEWTPDPGSFDLVASATAFHWVKPDVGYPRAAEALRPGGCLALFWNKHPTPYSGFFSEVQEVYGRVVPEWRDPRLQPTTEEWIRETAEGIDASRLFRVRAVRRYPFSLTFTSGGYLRLLDTFSDHRGLPEEKRSRLYDGIKRLIDGRYGGSVERPYLSVLFVADKL